MSAITQRYRLCHRPSSTRERLTDSFFQPRRPCNDLRPHSDSHLNPTDLAPEAAVAWSFLASFPLFSGHIPKLLEF